MLTAIIQLLYSNFFVLYCKYLDKIKKYFILHICVHAYVYVLYMYVHRACVYG